MPRAFANRNLNVLLLVACVSVTFASVTFADDDLRTWSSRSGDFKVEAEFAGAIGNLVRLRKRSGQVITVRRDQLSPKDLAYIAARGKAARSSRSAVASRLLESALLLAPFEGEAAGDRSRHGLKVVVRGASATPGVSGQGLRFDGKDDHVEIAELYPKLRQNLASLSLSLWLRRPQRKKTALVFDAGFYGQSVAMTIEANRCRFIMPPETGGTIVAFKLPPGNTWRHVALTWDGRRQVVYIDGKQVASGKTARTGKLTAKSLGGPAVVRLGSQTKAPGRGQRFFGGELDEVAVFAAALTPSQVTYLHRLGLQGKTLAVIGTARSGRQPRLAKIAPKRLGVYRAHAPDIRALAFSRDGRQLASSNGKEVKITDMRTRKVLKQKKVDYVQALDFSPDGKKVILCSLRPQIWDPRTDRLRQLTRNIRSGSPDATVRWLASGSLFHAFGNAVLPWDKAGDALGVVRFDDNGNSVSAWNITDDGKRIAGGQRLKRKNSLLRLIDYPTHKEVARFTHEGSITSVAFSGDGALLAVGLGGEKMGDIHLYDNQKLKHIATIPGKRRVIDMEFLPKSHLLVVSQSYPGIIRIWDADSRKRLAEIKPEDEMTINRLAVSPDGETLALGRNDGQISFWSLR